MNQRVALVAGGGGAVGEGIVRVFRQAGWTVLVPSRDPAKLEYLRSATEGEGELITLVGNLSNLESAAVLRQQVEEQFPRLDAVAAALGSWWEGQPLTEISLETWRELLQNGLEAHFITARSFLPLLRPGGNYIFINGISAEAPFPLSGPISVGAAGQLMLARVLAEENKAQRVNALLLGPIITRKRPDGSPQWLSADDVGRITLRLAEAGENAPTGAALQLVNKTQLENELGKLR